MFRWTARRRTRALLPAAAVLPVLLLCACGGSVAGDVPRDRGGELDLVASFYPLQFATQRVAGDLAAVRSLTRPGLEPHDVELTPRQVGSVADADLVVFLAGFQPAVDDALVTVDSGAGFDVSGPARLVAHPGTPHVEDDASHAGDEHASVH